MKTLKSTAMLATALVALAAVSCTKEETPSAEQENGINTITLSIEQPADEDATKTSLGTGSAGIYPVNWSAEDAVAVSEQSGSTFVKYTLSGGSGSTTGTFTTGETAPSGAVYAYYPYSQVKSVATTTYTVELPTRQTYAENSFGNGALPMFAVADAAGSLQSMKPLMSVLKLSLKGTCKVNRIVVSHASEKLSGPATVTFSGSDASLTVTGTGTYDFVELLCPDVQLEASNAKLFYIVVPASSAASAYTVRIVTDESKVLTKTLTTSTKFTAAKIKNANELTGIAPAEVKYVSGSYCGDGITVAGKTWAPVNCGYDAANAPTGLFYQWGRKYGQSNTKTMTDADFITTQAESMAAGNTEANKDKFYKGNACWFSGNTTSDTWSSEYDPCPAGWRVPTLDELTALKYAGSGWVTSKDITGKSAGSYSGRLFPATGDSQIFFPVAGYRSCSNGSVYGAATIGYYWSSSPDTGNANSARSLFFFDSSSAGMNNNNRAYGYSVRCVQE